MASLGSSPLPAANNAVVTQTTANPVNVQNATTRWWCGSTRPKVDPSRGWQRVMWPDIVTLDFGTHYFISLYVLPASSPWQSSSDTDPMDRIEEGGLILRVRKETCAMDGRHLRRNRLREDFGDVANLIRRHLMPSGSVAPCPM